MSGKNASMQHISTQLSVRAPCWPLGKSENFFVAGDPLAHESLFVIGKRSVGRMLLSSTSQLSTFLRSIPQSRLLVFWKGTRFWKVVWEEWSLLEHPDLHARQTSQTCLFDWLAQFCSLISEKSQFPSLKILLNFWEITNWWKIDEFIKIKGASAVNETH
jgi:hypothetical protein